MKAKRFQKMNTLQVAGRLLSSLRVRRRGKRTASGSFSVEAALVFPLLMVLLAALLRMIPIYALQVSLQRTLSEDGAAAALAAAAFPEPADEEGILEEVGGAFVSAAAVAAQMELLYGYDAAKAGLTGDFYTGHCRIGSSRIDLSVVTEVRIGLPGEKGKVRIITRSVHRTFTGISLAVEEDEAEDDIVYVTASGTVYHRSISCPYIRAAIQYCPKEKLASARSASGEIYRPCERCRPSEGDGGYYITPYGNRYHSTETCSHLLHNVSTLPLSEAAAKYRPCSKCGGE